MVTIGRTSNTYCYDDYYEQPAQHRQSHLDSKHAQSYGGGSEGPYHGGAGAYDGGLGAYSGLSEVNRGGRGQGFGGVRGGQKRDHGGNFRGRGRGGGGVGDRGGGGGRGWAGFSRGEGVGNIREGSRGRGGDFSYGRGSPVNRGQIYKDHVFRGGGLGSGTTLGLGRGGGRGGERGVGGLPHRGRGGAGGGGGRSGRGLPTRGRGGFRSSTEGLGYMAPPKSKAPSLPAWFSSYDRCGWV